jgi:WD40 repeat protein
VQAVAVSPDGRWLATGGDDSLVTIWDFKTGKKLKTFGGHRGAISALRFSPDGAKLLSGSTDKSIRVWDLAWDKLFARIQTVAAVNSVTWLENSKEIAAEVRIKSFAFGDCRIQPDGHRYSRKS